MAIPNTVAQFGPYRLRTRLAQSHTCDVWLAESEGPTTASPPVVLKKLRQEYAERVELVELLAYRATAARTLNHECIGRVLDVVRHLRDCAYTSEYHDGKTLRQLVSAVRDAGNALPVWFAVHVARSICQALEYAHGHRDSNQDLAPIFHLNLVPENVFITFEGRVKVTDFGLSHVALLEPDYKPAESMARATGAQPKGEGTREERLARKDLEGVGRILYELLTLRTPGQKTDRDLDFVPPSHHSPWVNAEVDQILRKTLSPSYPNRIETAADLHRALDHYLTSRRHDVCESHLAGLVTLLFSTECRDSSPPTMRFTEATAQLARLRSRRTNPPDHTNVSFENNAPTKPGLRVPASGQVTRPTLPSPAVTSSKSPSELIYSNAAPLASPASVNADEHRGSTDKSTPFHHDWDLALKRAREQGAAYSSGTFVASKPSTAPPPPPPPVDPQTLAVIEFEKGLELRQKGELQGALAAWEKALELDPQHRVCRANLNLLKKKLSGS